MRAKHRAQTAMLDRIQQLVQRMGGYLTAEPLEVAVELLVIGAVVYLVFRFLRGTRGAWAIKGLLFILFTGVVIFQSVGQTLFERLNVLFSNFLGLVSIVLVVVFQPELRRALVKLGETRFINKKSGLRKAKMVEELLAAVEYLAGKKIGALVAIERQVGLRGIIEQGTILNAEVTRQLLETIFWPNSPLHDLGVVIQGDRVLAAGVQFPLAEAEMVDPGLGSRHRAALGLSLEADALIVVVSEETGTISLAERGVLTRGLTLDELRTTLTKGLARVSMEALPTEDSSGTPPTPASKDEPDPDKAVQGGAPATGPQDKTNDG